MAHVIPDDLQAGVRLHVFIDGRVQGVGFRYFVQEKANRREITGWVRNTVDGGVEVIAEGSQEILAGLLEDLRQGPRAAYVTDIKQTWLPATGEFVRFEIRESF